jgi:hypothetical protein
VVVLVQASLLALLGAMADQVVVAYLGILLLVVLELQDKVTMALQDITMAQFE